MSMEAYPLKERIKEVLDQNGQRVGWLIGEINKSISWFTKLGTIQELQFKTIEDISRVLDYDFIKDYYEWQGKPIQNVLSEPEIKYEKEKIREMSVQLTIKGNEKTLVKNLGKMIESLSQESQKAGLKII